ncbi:MAG: hypothetical protein JXR19_03405 [Bacteroidia bacterium]
MKLTIYNRSIGMLLALLLWSACSRPASDENQDEVTVDSVKTSQTYSQQINHTSGEEDLHATKTRDSLLLINNQLSEQISLLLAQNNKTQSSLMKELEERDEDIEHLEDDLEDYEGDLKQLQYELERMREGSKDRPVAVGHEAPEYFGAFYCIDKYFQADKPLSIYRNEDHIELEKDLYEITLEECLKADESNENAWKKKKYFVNIADLPKCRVDTVDLR